MCPKYHDSKLIFYRLFLFLILSLPNLVCLSQLQHTTSQMRHISHGAGGPRKAWGDQEDVRGDVWKGVLRSKRNSTSLCHVRFWIIPGCPRDGQKETEDRGLVVGVGEVQKIDWPRQMWGNKIPLLLYSELLAARMPRHCSALRFSPLTHAHKKKGLGPPLVSRLPPKLLKYEVLERLLHSASLWVIPQYPSKTQIQVLFVNCMYVKIPKKKKNSTEMYTSEHKCILS